MDSSRRHRGFSLIETLIALAIIAAIAALVLPATYAQLTAAKFDQATREVILAGDACRSFAIGHSTTCRLVMSESAAGLTLSMESVEPASDGIGSSAEAASLRAASIGSGGQDESVRTRVERLYLVPEGLLLGRGVPASNADEPSATAGEVASAGRADPTGEPPIRDVLATFLPDGSVIGPAFELAGLDQRARFSTMRGAGRLTLERLAVETSERPVPSRSNPASKTTTEPRSEGTDASSESRAGEGGRQ